MSLKIREKIQSFPYDFIWQIFLFFEDSVGPVKAVSPGLAGPVPVDET